MASNDNISDISHRLYPGYWAVAHGLEFYYYIVVVIVGFAGNTLCACVMLRKRLRKMSTSVYIFVLAQSDLVVNMTLMFSRLEMQNLVPITAGYCKATLFLFYFSIHCSVSYVVALAVERFLVVWFPLKAAGWCTRYRAKIIVLVLTLVMFGVDAPNIFLRGAEFNEKDNLTECTIRENVRVEHAADYFLQKVFPWIDSAIYSYIPLVSLIVLNALTVRKYKSVSLANKYGRKSSSSTVRNGQQLTTMSLLVSLAFVVCTVPIATSIVTEQVWVFEDEPLKLAVWTLVRKICNSLMYSNHAVNFFLYCLSAQNFRDELKVMFFCRKTPSAAARARAGSAPSTSSSSKLRSGSNVSQESDFGRVLHGTDNGVKINPYDNESIEEVEAVATEDTGSSNASSETGYTNLTFYQGETGRTNLTVHQSENGHSNVTVRESENRNTNMMFHRLENGSDTYYPNDQH